MLVSRLGASPGFSGMEPWLAPKRLIRVQSFTGDVCVDIVQVKILVVSGGNRC